MGCFTACFRHSKHKKIINSAHNNAIPPSKNQCLQSLLHSHDDVDEVIIKEAQTEDTIKPIADSKGVEGEELNRSSRKKVTFDLSVETFEDDEKKGGANEAKKKSSDSYPLNHRYHNCTTNGDDEELEEDLGLEDIDLENNNGLIQEEESSESLFSLSIESRKSVSQPEMADKEEEVSSTPLLNKNPIQKDANPISQFAQSVLNPIENNMTQWKKAANNKSKTPPLENQEKENQNLDLMMGKEENEIAVDTSLSYWLIGSKNSSDSIGKSPSDQTTMSPKKFEDRPILGLSKSSSPRRCSPDEKGIIGTVGSYWRHTGQATDSDSGSSCKGVSSRRRNIKKSSTPFQTRLESEVDNGTISQD